MGEAARVQQDRSDAVTDRLRAVLLQLARDRDAMDRDMRQTAETHDQALRLVIGQIDETVLPRRIEMLSGDHVIGSFVASNRRLIDMSVAHASPNGEAGETGTTEDVALQHVETIRSLAERAGKLVLRPAGRASIAGAGERSCSTRSLLRAGQALGQEARITRLLDRIAPHSEGWICHVGGGEDSRSHGPEDIRDVLMSIDAALGSRQRQSGTPGRLEHAGPSCSVLAMGPGLQAIVARDGRSRILACVRQSEVDTILSIWRALFGKPGQGARPPVTN